METAVDIFSSGWKSLHLSFKQAPYIMTSIIHAEQSKPEQKTKKGELLYTVSFKAIPMSRSLLVKKPPGQQYLWKYTFSSILEEFVRQRSVLWQLP